MESLMGDEEGMISVPTDTGTYGYWYLLIPCVATHFHNLPAFLVQRVNTLKWEESMILREVR